MNVVSDDFGNTAILITFDSVGRKHFSEATLKSIGRRIGLVVNDILLSAPHVNIRIEGGNMQISGRGLTEYKCKYLVDIMNMEKGIE